ncbi:hypothetical protein NCS57_01139300 [Fusarium keratoplasticum]|uniref:Uncharacterized protein n=1 Tax=Fusarium keratoplasticum TaxID=1328300 RepID=A0ACC0QLC9_9HYPO|nr:hypothetical protein NCS57_01139300 [Fusarium keratoplasticum]KAI8657608.1 hypothetical protein NCS57_01139300 [Fusarium keratoplasticum]
MPCFATQISRVSPRKVRPALDMLGSGTEIGCGKETPGWIRLAQEQQLDPRHMIAPRCTAIAWSCVIYRARRVLRVWKEIQQKSLAGEEDIEELLGQLTEEQDQYQRLLLQTSQTFGIDQPDKSFQRHLLPSWRTLLGPEDDAIFAEEMKRDWVSLSQPQKLDQMVSRMLATRIGRWVFVSIARHPDSLMEGSDTQQRPFLAGKEKIGGTTMYNYHEGLIKALILVGFSCIIGVFACAPVAIQSLNVNSVAGEVATYLVFMIVFAWLSQALLRGDEKILLTCLAYAALMATVMRQGE